MTSLEFSSLVLNNKTVQSLTIGNKEVQSITRLSDNAIIYQKQQLSIPYHIYDDEITYSIYNYNAYIIEDGSTFEIYGALEEPTTIGLESDYVWTDEDMFLFRVNNEMGIEEWQGEELTNPFPTYIVFNNGVWYLYDNNTLTNPFQSINDNGLTFEDGNINITLICEDETNLTFMVHTERIQTHFVQGRYDSIYLYDNNDNGLVGKTVTVTPYNGQTDTYTTGDYGFVTSLMQYLSYPIIIVFDGDDEYKSCTLEYGN